jgi:hypothetical protein
VNQFESLFNIAARFMNLRCISLGGNKIFLFLFSLLALIDGILT